MLLADVFKNFQNMSWYIWTWSLAEKWADKVYDIKRVTATGLKPATTITRLEPETTWVFIYKLIGCEFESHWSHLNFRYRTCFKQGVPLKRVYDMIRTYNQTSVRQNSTDQTASGRCCPRNIICLCTSNKIGGVHKGCILWLPANCHLLNYQIK